MPRNQRQDAGPMFRLIFDARRFFKNTRIIHIIMTVFLLGTGVSALVLSNGSDGTAQVPYFFSAFISGAWQISLIILCQVCIYYLYEDGSRITKAETWVRAYSISSSLFVLFNVMGVVFTVVNGVCMGGQMCYYDRNIVANRAMAILLIIEHCACILFSVLLAKRAHVIDAELNSDVSVKLNHPFNYFRRSRSRKSSVVSPSQRTPSEDSAESVRDERPDTDSPDLHHVHTDHEGKALSTVEITAKRRKLFRKRRSKSHPNLSKATNELHVDLKPEDAEGKVYTLYSDSEMKIQKEKNRKKIFVRKVKSKNRVSVINKPRKNSSDDEIRQEVEIVQTTTLSLQSSGSGVLVVAPISPEVDDSELNSTIEEQMNKTLQEAGVIAADCTPPPPYETLERADDATSEETMTQPKGTDVFL